MIARPVDQAARDRITSNGLGETLFVEAGAGTGKTSTLVARMVGLVTDQQVPLRELAAITFTEAAAAELRERVRRAFEEGVDSGGGFFSERCRDALAELDGAAISTLHAFAQRLLSLHPLEVAIPPRVVVLDEVQSTLAFESRWQQAVRRWHAEPAFEPLIVRLESCGVRLQSRSRASMKDIAAVFNANWDRLEDLATRELVPPRRLDRAGLLGAIDSLLAIDGSCTDADDRLHQHLVAIRPELERVRGVDPNDDDLLLRLLASRTRSRVGRSGRATSWPDVAVARALFVAVDEAADALTARAVDDVLGLWVVVLRDFTLEAAHARRDAGELEFHDLLVLARRLLRTSPTARQALHDRFTRLLLDEFQDTDPIQIELAMLIAAGPAADHELERVGAGGLDWASLEAPRGRVFMVGDPKQSIYRFRRADIALYQRARDTFGSAAHVSLVQNFRTVEPIVAWINAVFGTLMPEERVGQPRYAPLAAIRQPSPQDHRVCLFGAEHGDGPDASTVRTREAADVAAIVQEIRAAPEQRPVWDVRAEMWRGARLGDITVLIPSRQSLPMLEEAFATLDIAYRIDTSTLVFDAPEVRDLLAIVAAIDDPDDELAVVAALRSPVMACNDRDLFTWRASGGSWDYRDSHRDAAATCPVGEAMSVLASWHELARWCEPAVLLERIVRERHVFALALADRRPRDAWRRVRYLIDQARRFSDVGAGHLREFLDWADLQRRDGARVPEPLLPETDDDAVRVMTFHGAKGLEFPIVILSGLTTRSTGRRTGPQVLWDPSGNPAIRLNAGAATENFEVRNDFEAEMDDDEKLRLLYVGATRARDHLFVSTHRTPPQVARKDTHAARLHDASTAAAAVLACSFEPRAAAAFGGAGLEKDAASVMPRRDLTSWRAARRALLEKGAARSVWSATALAQYVDATVAATTPRRPAPITDRSPDADADADAELAQRRSRAATAFGRAVHAVLQHVDVGDRSTIAELARRAVREEVLAESLVHEIAQGVTGVLALPTVARALVSPRHWRELAVCGPLQIAVPGPSSGPIVEGFVDLLAEIDGELVVVDYKTDRLDDDGLDEAIAHHTPQLAVYAAAIEAATGQQVARAVLVFTGVCARDGSVRPVERSVPDLRGAVAAVRRTFAQNGS